MRVFVACIVALSLPLQGLASTFMMHCAGGATHGQHAAQPSTAQAHSGHGEAVVTMVASAIADDSHGSVHVHSKASKAGDDSSSPDRASCAVCCAAVITQARLVVAPDLSCEPPLPLVVPASPERNPGGIERPPRFSSR